MQVFYTRVFSETAASRKRIIVNVGGARSSKSYSVAQVIVGRFLSRKNYTAIISRKTFPALRATAMADIIAIMKSWGVYVAANHNKSDCTITNPTQGNIIRFVSIVSQDGQEGPTRIRSLQANDIWIEEANELSWQDFLTLRTRLSAPSAGGEPNQIFLTLNPSDAYGWINQKLVGAAGRKTESNVEVIVSNYKDNPTLDADYIADLERLKDEDETYYKIFTLGVWAQAKSIIYSKYDVLLASAFPVGYDELIGGLDFGYNHPSAALHIAMVDGEAWIRQIVHQSHLTNQDLIDKTKELMPDWMLARWRGDSAQPGYVEEFHKAGFQIESAPKGPGSVKEGIDFAKRLRLHFCDEDTELVKEVRGYKWREKDGEVLDEPLKFRDDGMDAMRYAFTSLAEYQQPASAWGGKLVDSDGKPEWT